MKHLSFRRPPPPPTTIPPCMLSTTTGATGWRSFSSDPRPVRAPGAGRDVELLVLLLLLCQQLQTSCFLSDCRCIDLTRICCIVGIPTSLCVTTYLTKTLSRHFSSGSHRSSAALWTRTGAPQSPLATRPVLQLATRRGSFYKAFFCPHCRQAEKTSLQHTTCCQQNDCGSAD